VASSRRWVHFGNKEITNVRMNTTTAQLADIQVAWVILSMFFELSSDSTGCQMTTSPKPVRKWCWKLNGAGAGTKREFFLKIRSELTQQSRQLTFSLLCMRYTDTAEFCRDFIEFSRSCKGLARQAFPLRDVIQYA